MNSGADTSYQTTEDRGRKTGRTVPQQGSLCRLSSDFCRLEVGFPIRKSADQSLFAAPHGLSQRTTSFIACAYQGIHRTPLRHLIALIINARPFRGRSGPREERKGTSGPGLASRIRVRPHRRERPCGLSAAPSSRRPSWKDQCHTRTARRRGGQASPAFARPLRDVRTTLLFTMSTSIPARRTRRRCQTLDVSRQAMAPQSPGAGPQTARVLVEPDGIEPTTSCLQSRRSPN